MDSEADEAAGESRRRARSLDATVLVALASVVVALVFNGLQIRNSAEQLDQGQRNLDRSVRADEFTTFIEMHDRVVRAHDETLTSSVAFLKLCRGDDTGRCRGRPDMFVPAALEVLQDITPFEGVVYALERGVLPAEAAKVWTLYLVCDYRTAARELISANLAGSGGGPGLAGYTPRLARFAREHPVRQESCPITLE